MVLCKKCGVEKELNKDNWKPNKAMSTGWQLTQCRECFNAYYRDYWKDNPDKRREKERKYAESNPEKYAEKQKRHHEREKELGKTKYSARNREVQLAYCRKRSATEKRKEYERERWAHRQANGYNEHERTRYAQDPTKKRMKANRRRVVKLNATGSHTIEQFMEKLKYYAYKCAYCRCDLSMSNVTEDHRIPLSRGGTDFISNIVPACSSCNSSKGARTEQEYRLTLKGVVL